jgi:hypothetical protein
VNLQVEKSEVLKPERSFAKSVESKGSNSPWDYDSAHPIRVDDLASPLKR